ncbi:MAG: ABC transporter ATP-binding protein, partial [Chloroflexota bacterium]
MLKLVKHLRPFIWSIAAISVLLFAQAMSDLSLPSYMSRIVNIGVQQNGIENAVPQAIRASELSKLSPFMLDRERQQVLANYILLDSQSLAPADYSKYVKSYPQLATAPLYQLGTTDKTQIAQLDTIFGEYLPVIAIIERGGTTAQLSALPQSTVKQYAIAYISAEYKAIGMNMSGIQTAYMMRIGLLMLLLTLAGAACSIAVGYLSARIAAGVGRDLRRKLFVRVESFSNTEFDKFSTASLITRTTNDIT